MITVDARVHLKHFQVRGPNEDSPDEPFLWVVGIKFDGVTSGHLLQDGVSREAILARAARAELEFFIPPGRHGNLGPASDDVDTRRILDIPHGLGLWNTTLRIDPLRDPPELARLAIVAIIVVALEEDGTSDTHAIEAHRRVTQEVRERTTRVLRAVLAEAVESFFDRSRPSPSEADVRERLHETLTPRVIYRVIDRLKDDVIPFAVVKGIFNVLTLPATIAQSDADDFVGQGEANFSMPRLVAEAVDGFDIEFELNRNRTLADILESLGAELPEAVRERTERELLRSEEGNYHVSGRARRMDLYEPPTIGCAWQTTHALVVARGTERRPFFARMSDTGERGQWASVGEGILSSGVGVGASIEGKRLFVVGRGQDNNIWLARSLNGPGDLDTAGWRSMPALRSRYGATAAYAQGGDRLHVFAVDENQRVRWSWSRDEGDSWSLQWGYCGEATLDSSPAAAITLKGEHLNIFGLGQDRNIWRAYSPDGGINWTHLWSRSKLPEGHFRSAPAVAMSFDGRRLFLCVKGARHYFWLRSEDFGDSWSKTEWNRLAVPDTAGEEEPFFVSAPGICASPDLKEVHLFGVCSDLNMYWRRAVNDDWSPWERMGDRLFV